MRLTNKGKNKAAKYRKEKRENIQNRQLEQEELEQEESKVLKLTEFVTANELANMMDIPVTSGYLNLYECGYHGVYQPASGCRND